MSTNSDNKYKNTLSRVCILLSTPVVNLCIVLIWAVTLLVHYNGKGEEIFCETNHEESVSQVESWKGIFLLTPFLGRDDGWERLFKRLIVGRCPESRCLLMSKLADLHKADAVVMSAVDLPPIGNISSYILKQRRLDQPWVFFNLEPPNFLNKRVNLVEYDGFFNWTMTYKPESDIFVSYGIVLDKTPTELTRHYLHTEMEGREDPFDVSSDDFYRRDHLVTIVVSRCRSQSKRETLIKEMRRFTEVKVFGKCGKSLAGRKFFPFQVEGQPDETESIIPHYFFYLAFECENCDDFLSEHFFRALRLGVVPVVMGGTNMEHLAPKDSYIDATDFETVEQLVAYMKEVADYPDLYAKYHEWRYTSFVLVSHPYITYTCELCLKLHQKQSMKRKEIEISKMFSTNSCYPYNQLNFQSY